MNQLLDLKFNQTMITAACIVILFLSSVPGAVGDALETSERITALTTGINLKKQKHAVKAWSAALSERDYKADEWMAITKQDKNLPSHYFDYYAQKLSDTFQRRGANVNFVLTGACDGTNDNTIRDRYIPNQHWRGVFVEPFEMNFKDLSKFMEEHGVANRTHLIHGAATSVCNSTTLKMKRPNTEEKDPSKPHWMR